MLAAALVLVAAAAPVIYEGRTAEGRRVVVTVAGGEVVRVRAGVRHYPCETFGELGPVVVDVRGTARVSAARRFAFAGGVSAERLTASGRFDAGRRTVRGTLRLTGTIATGQRCRSGRIAFTARR